MHTPRLNTSGRTTQRLVWRGDFGRGPLDPDRAAFTPGDWSGRPHARPSRPRRSASGSFLFHWLLFAALAWLLLIYSLR